MQGATPAYYNKKNRERKMKKIAYIAPEMEVMDIKMNGMLCASQSGEQPDFGGQGDPNDPDDDPA